MQRERRMYSKGVLWMLVLLFWTGILSECIIVVWSSHDSIGNWIVIAGMITICLVCAYLYSLMWMQNDVLRRGIEVLGTVSEVHYVNSGKREYVWLECRYRDLFGKRYVFRSRTIRIDSAKRQIQVGDRVPIVYIPTVEEKYLVMIAEAGCSSPLRDCA